MFGKDKDHTDGKIMHDGNHETIIGLSVKVDGDFVSEGDILVRGVVNGSIRTKGNVRAEEHSKIKANIDATNAIIDGQVKGNITIADNLEIGEKATVEGDIIAKVLSIAPGAILNGHCTVSLQKTAERDALEVRSSGKVIASKTKEAL